MAKKKFRLLDAVLSVICVVFVAEAIAPAAAIGNQQFFGWIFLIVAFLLPYGLIVSELGTSYADDEGGLYDWIRRAFGDKWGARISWYYWINFPLWIASLAVLFPSTIGAMAGIEFGVIPSLVIEFVFIWTVIFISFSRASDAIWIMNVAAVLKVAIALCLGGLGIYFAVTSGFASDMSPQTFFPSFDANALSYLSIILFNFLGFEVIATYAGDMENPRVQIPKAIIIGGIVIAAIYMVSSFGIGAAIPSTELSLDSGIMDAVAIMAGNGSLLLIVVGIVFLLTLFGNMVSWSFGVNFVAICAAKDGNMPKAFSTETKKNNMPKGVAIANGVIASVVVILLPMAEALGIGDYFWVLFSVGVVFLLFSYIPMFPAYLKLRRVDADRERLFKVPGSETFVKILAWIPAVLLVLAAIITVVPLNGSEEELAKVPMLVAVIVFLIAGEVVRVVSARKRTQEYLGMEKSGEPAPRSLPEATIVEEEEGRAEHIARN